MDDLQVKEEYDKNTTKLPGEFLLALGSERPEFLEGFRNRLLADEVTLDKHQQARLVDFVIEHIEVRRRLSDKIDEAAERISQIRQHVGGVDTIALSTIEMLEDD